MLYSSVLRILQDVMIVASISMPKQKNIRFGAEGRKGTEAFCKVVKAGVFSCNFCLAFSACALVAWYLFRAMEHSTSSLSRSDITACEVMFLWLSQKLLYSNWAFSKSF